MPVYMIQAGGGPVKIGTAASVYVRLHKMRSDNHEPLSVIRILIGGVAEEAFLHERFEGRRIRGEWFRFCPDMLGDVGLADIPLAVLPPERLVPALGTYCGVIFALGGPSAVARRLGTDASSTVCKWTKRGIPPRYWHRIAELTEGVLKTPLTTAAIEAMHVRASSEAA